MARAIVQYDVSRQVLVDGSWAFIQMAPPPREPWFVRGPRGGLHVATGKIERRIVEDNDRWDKNLLTVAYISEGTKYVRPNSKLAREATV